MIREKIREAMEAQGLSINGLARMMGMGAGSLSLFLNGRRGISIGTLERLMEMLGLTIEMPTTARHLNDE